MSKAGKLNEAQFRFTWMIGELIKFAYRKGYRLTFGCARCAKVGHHMPESLHYVGLAIDFNLFVPSRNFKGELVYHYTKKSKDHRELGEFWEMLGGSWGGRFESPDGNHYSLSYGGKK